jgi:hypothetical protein
MKDNFEIYVRSDDTNEYEILVEHPEQKPVVDAYAEADEYGLNIAFDDDYVSITMHENIAVINDVNLDLGYF